MQLRDFLDRYFSIRNVVIILKGLGSEWVVYERRHLLKLVQVLNWIGYVFIGSVFAFGSLYDKETT